MNRLFCKARIVMIAVVTGAVLVGCQSTSSRVSSVGPGSVGPGSYTPAGTSKERKYNYSSDVFLDVAIPVFDPGLPTDNAGVIDWEEVADEGIWPQVRRLEANQFSMETKKALEKTKAFGSVSITPNAGAVADVYVLGNIVYSDSEMVEINVKVMDATNHTWGEKTFEHQVSRGFFRDAMNKDKDPYGPIYANIASWVYDLLNDQSDEEKQEIERVSDIRYAALYSNEAFGDYLTISRGEYKLTGLPAENDRMWQRIQAVKAKDEQFIDSLQNNYETFYVSANSDYRKYQRETLPLAIEAREKREARNAKMIGAGILTVAAILLDRNSSSGLAKDIAIAGAGVAGVLAYKDHSELSELSSVLDEAGSSLDIKVSPQVIEFEGEQIELAGTAAEQHAQLQAKLRELYELESTPDNAL
ncbi:MAG: hypothetical protein HWE26_04935 [Alteromonadaceae bacterium]|nr:hypothetical protein [Alteromonadaceae bacterium]